MSLALASLRKLLLLPAALPGQTRHLVYVGDVRLRSRTETLMRVRPPLGCIFSLSLICAEASISKESRVKPLFNDLHNNPMAHLEVDTKIPPTRKHKNEIIF